MRTVTTPQVRRRKDTVPYTEFRIRNMASFVVYTIIAIGIGFMGLLYPIGIGFMGYNKFGDIVTLVLVIIGILLILLRARACFNGVYFNVKDDIIEFPGGGISCNSIFDLINPLFILQYFFIHTRRLSDIEMITYEASRDSKSKRVVYGVTIMGKFGVAFIKMDSANKAKSLYNTLIRIIDLRPNLS